MQQSELQALGQHIQTKLQQLPSPIRLRIRCAFREEALLILAEHLLHIEPAPRQTFATIAEGLQEYTPELMKSGLVKSGIGGTKFLPVRIYLRVAGYQQPYDSFVFSLKPLAPPTSANLPIPAFVPSPVVATPPEPMPPMWKQVEPVEKVEFAEEQLELLDNPIAKITPALEPALVIETSAPQTDWLPDRTIAEVIPVETVEPDFSSEVAINEPVFAENEPVFTTEDNNADVDRLPALEDSIPEEIAELPIAEEVIAELPPIALDDRSVEPEAIEDFLNSEEVLSAPEEIIPSQEDTVAPAAIDPVADDDVLLTVDGNNSIQNAIKAELDSVIDLQEESIVEEPIQSATSSPPIPPFYIDTLNSQLTPQHFLPKYLAITDAELTDSESLADLEQIETVDEPKIAEALDLPELDTTSPESALAPQLRETLEPEALVTNNFSFVSLAPEDPVIQPPIQTVRASQLSSSSIMIGTAIALFSLLGGWYILSRPCVLGSSCEPLQQAQQISQAAFQTVQSTESAIAIAKAYDDLGTANKLLKSIPSWSGQHQLAQTLIADNESKSAVIGQLVRTLRKGNEAANRSQNPPHPLPEWREIQRLWRESIAALEKIPNNTAIYLVAQRKATEYRANLDGINKRVIVEQQAQEEVDNAKKTAQLAETRTGIATSAAGWRDVYTSWQAAIDLLKNVSKGAAARLEAEELLRIYQVKLSAAGTRRDQENIAIAAYTEAIAQAEQAQNFQQKNQWQNAIAAWEGALANVQKVVQGTTPYGQAQPLIATYQTALTQAQGGLRTSEAIQAAKPALDRTCGNTPKVCQYDAAPTAIRVQITYGYDQMVESAMTSAQAQGNSTARADVVSQVNTFLQELALISQTTQVPIELYNANGSKFGTYSPEASGFVPQ